MHKLNLLIGAALFCFAVCASAQSVSRTDRLECGFKEGDKFVLVNRYDWFPLAELIPADVTKRLYDSKSVVTYVSRNGKRSSPVFISAYQNADNFARARDVCENLFKINGVPTVRDQFLLKSNQWSAPLPERSDNFIWHSIDKSDPIWVELAAKNLDTLYSIYAVVDGKIVHEQGLADIGEGIKRKNEDLKIKAVYQSFLSTDGKSWGPATITTNSKIYELGKTLSEQSFAATPLRFNGKRLKPAK